MFCYRLEVLLLTSSLLLLTFGSEDRNRFVDAFRSLRHWKNDLEQQMRYYHEQLGAIDEIIKTSIYSNYGPQIIQPQMGNFVATSRDVRFSDLVVPSGSLILEGVDVPRTVKVMSDRSRGYVDSKLNDLYHIENQLARFRQQLFNRTLIYKGSPRKPPHIEPINIPGTFVFKQLIYSHKIQSHQVDVKHINYTDVNQVLAETYMENPQFPSTDSQSRLFFEGRKTFWKTTFARELRSGCCDRLKPLHTNRMMTRSGNQNIMAPVLLGAQGLTIGEPPVFIRQLFCDKLRSQRLALRPAGINRRPEDMAFLPAPTEVEIFLENLIDIRSQNAFEFSFPKIIVFRSPVFIENVYLESPVDNRLVIGLSSSPNHFFDLSSNRYLMRYGDMNNRSQRVPGSVRIKADTKFLLDVNATTVNDVQDFYRFVHGNIVRLDRPTTISGSVRFDALPVALNSSSRVLMMRVGGRLDVGLLNGLRIPNDIIILGPEPYALKPGAPIIVRGSYNFSNGLVFSDSLQVFQTIDGLQMPAEVIPLNSNDGAGSAGFVNLNFVDGIEATAGLTIQSGKFDDLVIGNIDYDAQNLIMNSVFTRQPDGTHLIRAPLRVAHLKLNQNNQRANTGYLNGFKPQDLLELSHQIPEALYGRKTFLGPVEARECHFDVINNLPNWPSNLIRIDRPNVWQTVQTKLAFVNGPLRNLLNSTNQFLPDRVLVDRLNIEFYPNTNPTNYMNNINFSPEFYIIHQALVRGIGKPTNERYRILEEVRLINGSNVNGIPLDDVVRVDEPLRFTSHFTLVGKVDVRNLIQARQISSNHPFDAMDLVQFDKYRIPTSNSPNPVRLNNLVLGQNNRASFTHCQMLNGIPFSEFANSIMSLTRRQEVFTPIQLEAPINFEGFVRTESSLNGVKNFKQLSSRLAQARYSFEEGLQCNSVIIKV